MYCSLFRMLDFQPAGHNRRGKIFENELLFVSQGTMKNYIYTNLQGGLSIKMLLEMKRKIYCPLIGLVV